MINLQDGKFYLVCDICGWDDEENLKFNTFLEAVEGGKKLGWQIMRINNKWVNICSECKNKNLKRGK